MVFRAGAAGRALIIKDRRTGQARRREEGIMLINVLAIKKYCKSKKKQVSKSYLYHLNIIIARVLEITCAQPKKRLKEDILIYEYPKFFK